MKGSNMAISKKEQAVIDLAMKRLKIAVEADKHNREDAIKDLEFLNGDQWPEAEKKRREISGRPALMINLLPKFVDQVTGEMLQNTPQIKVRPGDTSGDTNIAKIRQGLISAIEYDSNSKGIYSYGSKQMVACGYGAWRVLTRYMDSNPFQQEIYLEGIRNPFLVYFDPSAKDQNYADAKWGFVLEKIPTDEFKERYPRVVIPTSLSDETDIGQEHWFDGDTVTVAEYFVKTVEKVEMSQLSDGRVIESSEYAKIESEYDENISKLMEQTVSGAPRDSQMSIKPTVVKTRIAEKVIIKQWVLTSSGIIDGDVEGNTVAGKYIPVILLKGKELNIEGKNYISSLIRHAKDPQKMVNYWNSTAAETIALAPKSPWIGTAKQFEGYENDYASANVENMPFLKYNADPEAGGPPQRVAPGNPPVAVFEQIRRGEENIKSVIGMFNADVGAPGSEQTGAAIIARQKPGDTGTYEFIENLNRAVLFTGKIINEMIPTIYDTERDVRVRNIDESETFVPVNTTVKSAVQSLQGNPEMFAGMDINKLVQTAQKGGEDARFNDITMGKYDVILSTGPSYATQRQESSALLMQLAQAMPQQMAVAADLIVENMDFKSAEELARRLRLPLVQQGLITPRPGDPQPQPQGISPEQMIQEALIKVEESKVAVNALKAENEKMKIQMEELRLHKDMIETAASIETKKVDAIQKETAAVRQHEISSATLRKEMMKLFNEMRKATSDNDTISDVT